MNSNETSAGLLPDTEGANTLFPGDSGALPLDARRVLVRLLTGPWLDGQRNPKLWPVLIQHEDILRSRLAELFLDLVIDKSQNVAFTRQYELEELDAPKLMRRMPLTFVDSVLLLYLRQRLTQADSHGERAVVDISEVQDQLSLYEGAANTDHAGFSKKVKASVTKFKDNNLLRELADDRFEVSPTLKLLFSADEVSALMRQYQALAQGEAKLAADPDASEEQAS